MVFRYIIHYLANNEQLVQRLSESYPMRRAARFVVYIFNRGKLIAEEQALNKKLSPEQLKQFARRFSNSFKEEISKTKQEFQRKK